MKVGLSTSLTLALLCLLAKSWIVGAHRGEMIAYAVTAIFHASQDGRHTELINIGHSPEVEAEISEINSNRAGLNKLVD
ncbi:hypothetical protein RRG08_058430 [Elysia crispata]|uniref:Uncharacterized protein n=1 Tax=Elysia crispata TaxID=231223 RepID=A0AAE1DX35_9GAST|nr:hypothetical protein RRG08_058430 [Elysia crispata]